MSYKATLTHKAKDRNDGPDRWVCDLDGESFPYSKGIGLRVRRPGSVPDATHPPHGPPGSVYEAKKWARDTMPVDPTEKELRQALAMDACAYLDTDGLAGFIAEYGPFSSAVAEEIRQQIDAHRACERAWHVLRRSMTEDQIRDLSCEEE